MRKSESFRPDMGLFNKIILTSDVGVCVHWPLCLARHQSTTGCESDGICGGPLFAPRSTSARVQSRVEFVELGGGMCSNYQGEIPGVTGITGWYQVPDTIHESTVYMYENIWYVQVLGSPAAYV